MGVRKADSESVRVDFNAGRRFAKLASCASAKSFTPSKVKAGSSARPRYSSGLPVVICAAFGAIRLTLPGDRKGLLGRSPRYLLESTGTRRSTS